MYVYIYIYIYKISEKGLSIFRGLTLRVMRDKLLQCQVFCIHADTRYPCLSLRGFRIKEGSYLSGFYTRYISHCHIYRKITFAKNLLV